MPLLNSPSNIFAASSAGATNTSSILQSATATGTSYPVNLPLPSWLNTDPNSIMPELSEQYQTAPKSITDAADKSAATMETAATQDYGMNVKQSQFATKQLANVSRQQGGTGKTSEIVAGQEVQGAQKQQTDARVTIAQMQQDAKYKAASLSANIAQTQAGLRSSYLGTLASFAGQQRAQDLNYSEFAAGMENSNDARAEAASAAAKKGAAGPSYSGMGGVGSGAYTGPLGANVNAGQKLLPGSWGG